MTGSLDSDLVWTLLLSAASLLAVALPLQQGLRTCLRARRATRDVSPQELSRAGSGAADCLALLMARVLQKSLRENRASHPREFILDATRQYVVHEYDARYGRVISMYANLLPPLGFIGTTLGLLVLFLSMHLADASLELGALAVALLSSVFALVGFALLEGWKLRLYARLLHSLDGVFSLQRSLEAERTARSREVASAAAS